MINGEGERGREECISTESVLCHRLFVNMLAGMLKRLFVRKQPVATGRQAQSR